MSLSPVRVVLVASPKIFRKDLSRLLAKIGNITVAAETQQTNKAHTLIMNAHADVVVLDMQLNGAEVLDLIRHLRHTGSMCGILVLVASENTDQIRATLEAGANSYILRSASAEELAEAIRDVYDASQVLVQIPLFRDRKPL